MFLSCITGEKKKMQPTLFLKVKDPLEFKLVFTVLSFSYSRFSGRVGGGWEISHRLFLQSKSPGTCPSPAAPLFAGFCHRLWFL